MRYESDIWPNSESITDQILTRHSFEWFYSWVEEQELTEKVRAVFNESGSFWDFENKLNILMANYGYKLNGSINTYESEYYMIEHDAIIYEFYNEQTNEYRSVILKHNGRDIRGHWTFWSVQMVSIDDIITDEGFSDVCLSCECMSIALDGNEEYQDDYEDIKQYWELKEDHIFCNKCNSKVKAWLDDEQITEFTNTKTITH